MHVGFGKPLPPPDDIVLLVHVKKYLFLPAQQFRISQQTMQALTYRNSQRVSPKEVWDEAVTLIIPSCATHYYGWLHFPFYIELM